MEVAMKNITLAVEDKVLEGVRQYAARRNTTVNALVREHLSRIASEDDRLAQARVRLRELAENSTAMMGRRPTRDEIYDRQS
jgi:hypothetical protein